MAITTVYNVVAKFRGKDAGMESKFDRLAGGADRLNASIDRAQARIGGLFRGLALGAGAAATGGLVLGARRMLNLGKAAEQAKVSIASTMSVLSDETREFSHWMGEADALFSEFSDRSIDSPATREEFIQLFQSAAPAITPLGLGKEQTGQFIQRAIGAGTMTGGDFEQTGRDIGMMLQGRAGTDVKTFVNLRTALFRELGVASTEAFNQMAKKNPAEVFDAINSALSRLDPGLKEFGTTTSGLMASATEMINRGLLSVFDSLKRNLVPQLERFVGWMKNNQGKVEAFADTIGSALGSGVEKLGDLIAWTTENADKLAAVLSTIGTMKGLGLLKDIMLAGGGAAMRGVIGTHAATQGIMGAISLGGSAAGSASRTGQNVMRMSTVGGAAATGVGGAAASGAGLGSIIPTLAVGLPVVVTLMGALAAGAIGLVGAWRKLLASSDQVADRFFTSMELMFQQLDKLAVKLGFRDSFDAFFEFADFMGTILLELAINLLDSITLIVMSLQGFVDRVRFFGALIGVIQQKIKSNPASLLKDGFFRESQAQARGVVADIRRNTGENRGALGRGQELAQRLRDAVQNRGEKTKDEEASGRPVVNVKNEINQRIESQANPDRIALATADVTGRKTRKSIEPFLKGL